MTAITCAPAEALLANNEAAGARALYVKDLEATPTLPCASWGIKQAEAALEFQKDATASAEAATLCIRGATYKEIHRKPDAIDSYKAALEKEPSNTGCGAIGLRKTGPNTVLRFLEGALGVLPWLAVSAGLLALALLIFLMIGNLPGLGDVWPKLPLLGRLLTPQISLVDCDDSALEDSIKIAKPFSAAIREQLERFRGDLEDPESVEYALDSATGGGQLAVLVSGNSKLGSALASLGEASDQTKLLAAVISVLVELLPIKRLSVSGVLGPSIGKADPSVPQCASTVRMTVERNSALVASSFLRSRLLPDPPNAADYMELGESAGVWVQFEVARLLANTHLRPAAAKSYAEVREGVEYLRADEPDRAEEAFETALELDPENWAAYLDLAMLKAHGNSDFAAATAILRRAVDGIRPRGGSDLSYQSDPSYYRLAYQLIAQETHQTAGDSNEAHPDA